MALSRFGASKYRNAVPHSPHREDWYRTALPPATASSAISTFTSEIKTTREWIITITPTGELSYRGYQGDAETMRVGSGGGVGDWDLSRLEDGRLVVGGLDGAIYVYVLPEVSSTPSPPALVHTFPPSSSPITNLCLHPTTPGILLASTVASPVAIYDLSTNPPAAGITLSAKEPKGMWSVAWKADGSLVAGVGRSGTGYIWDPRSSSDAVTTKSLPIQALKPARLAWINGDLFLSSFSKTRNRQYSLLSGSSLATVFTQSLDTNPGVLIPLIDSERKIIYTVGRGDMTIRQIELSGPQGYQETLHPLQFPLSSASLAAVHPAKLDVMKAEIARILVPVVDKDGDTLLPVSIKVPRRQLIDYHDDLYPDIAGIIEEQSAAEWFNGGDKLPLPISLDPSRRGAWETQVEKLAKERKTTPAPPSKPAPASQAVTQPTPAMAPNVAAVNTSPDAQPSSSNPQSAPETIAPVSNDIHPQETTSATPESQLNDNFTSATPESQLNDKLPLLADGETYTSTSYKVRVIADFLTTQVQEHKTKGRESPLMVGLQGPQGCGKTTLTAALVSYLKNERHLASAVLSIDDLYKSHDGLKSVAQQHPDNALLAGRGPPGTHDIKLAMATLQKVKNINVSLNPTIDFPIFEKSLCGGEGDRSSETHKVNGPLDLFILEGWSMGFVPLSESALKEAYDHPKPASPSTSKTYFPNHPISSLLTLNSYLSDFSSSIYPYFSALVQIRPSSYDYVFEWRLQQEHDLKSRSEGNGMTDEQVYAFVERYMPVYELWKDGIWGKDAPWNGKGLVLTLGKGREVVEVGVPPAHVGGQETGAEQAKEASPTHVAASRQSRSVLEPAAKAPRPEEEINEAVTSSTFGTPAPVAAPPLSSSASAPSTAGQAQASPAAATATTTERFNPNWSRKFLAGKSPLIPTYDSLPVLSSLHQDSQILKLTPHLAFFPIQGTGGRLCVHPLKKKGRVSVGGEGYLSGGVEIVDFDAELGEVGRVAIAGEDGVVRVWKVGEDGVQGAVPKPDQVLRGKGIDKFTQILFHPTARDLLVGVTNDQGQAHIRFWNLSNGEEVNKVAIPGSGVFRLAFSPTGDRVAVGTKDGRLLVFDPRNVDCVSSGNAHDSPRSFQISWIDDHHIITVGFSRGSQRKILLYRLPSSDGEVTTISSMTVDVSPSVLFPVYDPDTLILYIWGKGERVIQAYEVHPENEKEPITKLPGFTGSSPQVAAAFLPKRMVDQKKVEIAKAFRVTAKTLEEVSFTIPRNKPEFFQDDIYVPTLNIEQHPLSASDWLAGRNVLQERIDLNLAGMTPLSQAPKADTSSRKKFVPAKNVMSEEEKKRREMDALFAKAKMDESSSEEEPQNGLDPPDDDW